MPVCVECHGSDGALTYRDCACPVHPGCWEQRLQLCMAAGVMHVRCAHCWTVLWTRKRSREEDADAGSTSKRRM